MTNSLLPTTPPPPHTKKNKQKKNKTKKKKNQKQTKKKTQENANNNKNKTTTKQQNPQLFTDLAYRVYLIFDWKAHGRCTQRIQCLHEFIRSTERQDDIMVPKTSFSANTTLDK